MRKLLVFVAAPLRGAHCFFAFPRVSPGAVFDHPSGTKKPTSRSNHRQTGSYRLEHFPEWCRPGFHWYPTHFRKKHGNGWGTEVYSKSEIALMILATILVHSTFEVPTDFLGRKTVFAISQTKLPEG
jgi:hypothetical protein